MKPANQTNPIPSGGEILLYETPDGQVRVDVRLEKESVWLSLTQMAELFGRDNSVISRQLRTVFSSGGAKAGGNCCKKCNRSKRRINVQIEEWSV